MLGRKRKMENAAAMAMPAPSRTQNHHYAKSYAFEILAGTIALIILLAIGWMWLSYILDEAGIELSELVNAVFDLIVVGLSIVILLGIAWVGSRIWNYIESENHRRRLELEDKLNQRLQLQWQLGTSVNQAVEALTPEQKRFNSVLVQIVDDVYLNGEFTRQGLNAWARNNAGTMIPTGESVAVGAHSVIIKDISAWLRKHSIVIGPSRNEQWNFEDYPNREGVLNLLRIPATINRPNEG